MYSVLLVDDEKWIVQSIKAKGDWDKHQMHVVGEAFNGEEALQQIVECKPDIVLTDIRMPGMSGLALMEKVKENGLHTEFVVISGYSEFAYVKQALQLGAVDYMLKSIDEQEMDDVLGRLKLRLDKARQTASQELLSLLQTSGGEEEQGIQRILLQNKLPSSAQQLSAIGLIGASGAIDLPPLPVEVPFLAVKVARRIQAVLIRKEDQAAAIAHWKAEAQGLYGIGIGKGADRLNQLEAAIQSAALAASRYFITGRRGEVHSYREAGERFNEPMIRLVQAVKHRNKQAVTDSFEQLRVFMRDEQPGIQHAVHLYQFVLTLSQHAEAEPQEELAASYTTLLEMFEDVRVMLDYLEQLTLSGIEIAAAAPAEITHLTMKQIIAYMENDYASNLSLPMIAQRFNLHPNYISQLFQKEMKTTFTKLLMSIRLAHACRMLTETELTITDIAERIGYQDYFYFAKVFKKNFNLSPSQYRLFEGSRSANSNDIT